MVVAGATGQRDRSGGVAMHMQETIIRWAAPVFFALIALELLVARRRGRRGRRAYAGNDAVSSIGLGGSQIVGVVGKLLTFGI